MQKTLSAPLLALLAAALALGAHASAAAQGSLFFRGARAYAEGNFAEAATHFSDAYASDPDPTYLYHLGRALEGAGDPAGALSAYTTWMELSPDAPERAEVEATLDRLRVEARAAERLGDGPEPSATTTTISTTPTRTTGSLVRPSTGRRISPWPWVLVGGGALVFVAGAIAGGIALGTHGAADRELNHAAVVARENEAQAQATAATVLLVLGSAITLGGGAWGVYDLVSPSEPETPTDALTARLRFGLTGATLDVEF